MPKELKKLNLTKIKLIVFAALALVLVFGSLLYRPNSTEAITETRLKSNIATERVRVTYNDIKAGANVGDSSRKKITLFTLAGGDQIVSIVTNTTAAFVVPGVENTATESVVAEIGGVQVSDGNVVLPPSLSEPNFENGKGSDSEFMFYSESTPTQIVMTVRSGDGVASLDNLTSGQIDFYVTVIK
jgi:hypothetical protein